MVDGHSLESRRQEAIKSNQAFGVTRLRSEFRVKPGENAKPFAWIKSPYNNRKNPIYLVSDCVPLRQVKKSAVPSKRQLLARKISGLKAKLRGQSMASSTKLRKMLNTLGSACVVLDSETTGLAEHDEIIELAIIGLNGEVFFNERFNPTVNIHPEAEQIHGINKTALVNCVGWDAKVSEISQLLLGKKVVIFNAPFDVAMLMNTCRAFAVDNLDVTCAMQWASFILGATNRYGSISLSNALIGCGLKTNKKAHTALGDCEMTRQALIEMSRFSLPIEQEISALELLKADS